MKIAVRENSSNRQYYINNILVQDIIFFADGKAIWERGKGWMNECSIENLKHDDFTPIESLKLDISSNTDCGYYHHEDLTRNFHHYVVRPNGNANVYIYVGEKSSVSIYKERSETFILNNDDTDKNVYAEVYTEYDIEGISDRIITTTVRTKEVIGEHPNWKKAKELADEEVDADTWFYILSKYEVKKKEETR